MVDSLLGPGQSFDDTWTERVRSLPPEDREQLLRRADAIRGGGAVRLPAAFACYRTLGRDLDPETPEDADRLLWLLRRARQADVEVARVARRAAEGSPGTPLGIQGELCLAQFDREAGRVEESTRRLFDLRRAVEGRGDLSEGLVTANLGLCLLQEGRDIESLFLLRRAITRFEAVGETRPRLMTQKLLATVYARFEDWGRFDALSSRIEADLAGLPDEEREALQIAHRVFLAGTALERGDLQRSLEVLELIEADDPSRQTWARSLRAFILVRTGRAEEARQTVEMLRAHESEASGIGLWLETTEALCAAALEEHGEAVKRIEQVLDRLEDPALGSDGNRGSMLLHLAEDLRGREGFAEQAKRAYDGAAAGVLARIVEVSRFAREEPSLVALDGEERRILGALRIRLQGRQEEFLRSVALLLHRARERGEPSFLDRCGENGFLLLCAWCGRLRCGEDHWIPVGSYIPDDPHLQLSHGMCPDCREDHG